MPHYPWPVSYTHLDVYKRQEEHLDEELTREDFAAQVYLNADYLAKLFKQETGLSIGNYLVERRMAKARQLLSTTACLLYPSRCV